MVKFLAVFGFLISSSFALLIADNANASTSADGLIRTSTVAPLGTLPTSSNITKDNMLSYIQTQCPSEYTVLKQAYDSGHLVAWSTIFGPIFQFRFVNFNGLSNPKIHFNNSTLSYSSPVASGFTIVNSTSCSYSSVTANSPVIISSTSSSLFYVGDNVTTVYPEGYKGLSLPVGFASDDSVSPPTGGGSSDFATPIYTLAGFAFAVLVFLWIRKIVLRNKI